MVEHLRRHRWLVTLIDTTEAVIVLLVQACPLIISADVLDLAEIVQVHRPAHSILWAYDGSFSPAAHRTVEELADERLRLCVTLPPAAEQAGRAAWQGDPVLKPNLVRPLEKSRQRHISLTTFFSSSQQWGGPDQGMQLFGTCSEARESHAIEAEQLYGDRFSKYATWKANLDRDDAARAYRFYRFLTSALHILDEKEFGAGVFVYAAVQRGARSE